ncbi:hypothetical protein OD917_09055 [Flavobacterium sp. SH_e]|uniref:hypothetical protein n=1 Tax=Flavobacterium TaxID=237 RepID=UPI0021E3D671|nr:hypothetical protein [Flavobacterium sp. SH_e]MCV2485069.1 hypothetical protein [Flavobacterium sp. SH_e]
MDKNGPIIIIEESIEDFNLFEQIFQETDFKNNLLYFSTFTEAKEHLISLHLKPFLFFSNILKFNGNCKQDDIDYKDIYKQFNSPCLFYSIFFSNCFVIDAYSTPTKSYFVKPYREEKFKEVLTTIVQYWKAEKRPKLLTKEKKEKQNF